MSDPSFAGATESRRTPKAERTRAAILAAAETFFAEHGFAATRLEDVAAQVGIRRASIVYYFRDKQALYDAVVAEVLNGLFRQVEPALGGSAPLLERIEEAVGAWVDYVGGRPTFARLLLREIAAGSGPGTAVRRHTAPFVALARKAAEDARRDPVLSGADIDPAHLASTIAGATVFFVAAMPALFPALEFDPVSREQLGVHREEVLRITRRLLGVDGNGGTAARS